MLKPLVAKKQKKGDKKHQKGNVRKRNCVVNLDSSLSIRFIVTCIHQDKDLYHNKDEIDKLFQGRFCLCGS